MNKITKKDVMNYLNRKGFKQSLTGYYYLTEAILMGIEDTSIVMHGGVTKRLYPSLANMFNKTPSQTERAIRHAIETSKCVADSEIKPTNSEFICTAVNELAYGGE